MFQSHLMDKCAFDDDDCLGWFGLYVLQRCKFQDEQSRLVGNFCLLLNTIVPSLQ